jgi:hypothetical protein
MKPSPSIARTALKPNRLGERREPDTGGYGQQDYNREYFEEVPLYPRSVIRHHKVGREHLANDWPSNCCDQQPEIKANPDIESPYCIQVGAIRVRSLNQSYFQSERTQKIENRTHRRCQRDECKIPRNQQASKNGVLAMPTPRSIILNDTIHAALVAILPP